MELLIAFIVSFTVVVVGAVFLDWRERWIIEALEHEELRLRHSQMADDKEQPQ